MADFDDTLAEQTRALSNKFEEQIAPHRQSLWNYCRYLTGSAWDGEDLFQETLLKAFATMAQIWQPIAYKSYLFRIATNTRIDGLRKKKGALDSYGEAESIGIHEPTVDWADIMGALELLVQLLPPRQIAVFLLMEVYSFTAAEVAGMVRMTEGSVYAALHRARANLRKFREGRQPDAGRAANEEETKEEPDYSLLNVLLGSLRSGDFNHIVGMFADSVHNDAKPGFQEYSKQQMLDGSLRHRGPMLHVSLQSLWGRSVFVVLAETESGLALHDVQEFEFENGRIVYHRGYYFCREMLLEAGKVLGIPVQLQKEPNIDWRQAGEEFLASGG